MCNSHLEVGLLKGTVKCFESVDEETHVYVYRNSWGSSRPHDSTTHTQFHLNSFLAPGTCEFRHETPTQVQCFTCCDDELNHG